MLSNNPAENELAMLNMSLLIFLKYSGIIPMSEIMNKASPEKILQKMIH